MSEKNEEEVGGFKGIVGAPIDRKNVPVSSLSGASGGTDGVRTGDPIPPGRDTMQNTIENRGKEQDPADLEAEGLLEEADEDEDDDQEPVTSGSGFGASREE